MQRRDAPQRLGPPQDGLQEQWNEGRA